MQPTLRGCFLEPSCYLWWSDHQLWCWQQGNAAYTFLWCEWKGHLQFATTCGCMAHSWRNVDMFRASSWNVGPSHVSCRMGAWSGPQCLVPSMVWGRESTPSPQRVCAHFGDLPLREYGLRSPAGSPPYGVWLVYHAQQGCSFHRFWSQRTTAFSRKTVTSNNFLLEFLAAQGVHAKWDVPPNQPMHLYILQSLCKLMDDPDVDISLYLIQGVPIQIDSDIGSSNCFPLSPPSVPDDTTLLSIHHCNWQFGEQDPATVQELIGKEVSEAWVSRFSQQWPKGVAIGPCIQPDLLAWWLMRPLIWPITGVTFQNIRHSLQPEMFSIHIHCAKLRLDERVFFRH